MTSAEIASDDRDSIRQIVSSIPDATAAFDGDGLLVATNSGFLELWAFNAESDAIGTQFSALWMDVDEGRNADQSLRLGGIWSKESTGLRNNGEHFDIYVAQRRIREAGQFPDIRFVSFMDLSGRRSIFNALIESEQRFRDVTEAVSDLILELDAQGTITYMSEQTGSPVGPDLDIKVGANFFDLAKKFADHGGKQTSRKEGREMFYRQEPFADFRTEFVDPDGQHYVWLRSGVPKFDTNGQFEGYRIAQRDITNKTHREEALIRSEMRVQAIMDNVAMGIATIDAQGQIESFNPSAQKIFGYSSEEMIGQNLVLLMPKADRAHNAADFAEYLESGEGHLIGSGPNERTGLRRDGTEFPMELAIAEMAIDGRRTFIGSFLDLTEKKEAEHQYQQAKKMETVGKLTGGIAHDFNNLLAVLALNLELLSDQVQSDEKSAEIVDALTSTVQRGAALTQRLLSFSRQQDLKSAPLDINLLITELNSLIVRTFPAHVDIQTNLGADSWMADVDAHQLENALLNLCINARDAMPDGGTLTIETHNRSIESSEAADFDDITAGDYVELTLKDTGTGIAEDMIDRVIEPFFTTKQIGSGTGLGLSMVYGFVRQSRGHLKIISNEGQGTMVKMYFPKSTAVRNIRDNAKSTRKPGSIEGLNVLIVEDDPDIQKVLLKALAREHCKAHAVKSGPEAIDWLNKQANGPDLLLTDIVLPGGSNGSKVAEDVTAIFPECATIFMSGYLDEEISDYETLSKGNNFLAKPFTMAQLLKLADQVLSDSQAARPL